MRERRAIEINEGVAAHLGRGGGALFVTLTLRHGRFDDLDARLGLVTEALWRTLKGSAWDRRRDRLGYLGSIRAVEVTWGEQNGWHPHVHVLVLFERPVVEADRADLEQWLHGRWSKIAEDRGFGTVSCRHGVDVRPVHRGGDALGAYLTKVQGGWTAGHELARGDRKGTAPLEVLRRFVLTGDKRDAALWLEYEAATFGRRSLRWSPGLRGQLLGIEEDQADAELAASEGADLTLVRALIDSQEWNRCVRSGATGHLLTMIEHGAAALLVLAETMGHNPQPLDDPRAQEVGAADR